MLRDDLFCLLQLQCVHAGESFVHCGRYGTDFQVVVVPLFSGSVFIHFLIVFSFVFRELLENVIAPKPKRLSAADHQELTQLLIAKDEELKKTLKVKRKGDSGGVNQSMTTFFDFFHFSWRINRARSSSKSRKWKKKWRNKMPPFNSYKNN